MTASDRMAVEAAMKHPLLLDRGSGVYWDFDFEKEEFRVGTACNTGLIVDLRQKFDEGLTLEEQLELLIGNAEEMYNENV